MLVVADRVRGGHAGADRQNRHQGTDAEPASSAWSRAHLLQSEVPARSTAPELRASCECRRVVRGLLGADQREDERHREQDRHGRGSARAPDSRPSPAGTAARTSIRIPARSVPKMRPIPFVVVASPEIAPRSSGGISLKSSPQASVITAPAKMRDDEDDREVPRVPLGREPAAEQRQAVDDRAPGDHPGEAEAVADRPCDERREDVAGRHGGEHERRGRERLAEADRDVEDDERPRPGERALPGRVREQEPPDVGVARGARATSAGRTSPTPSKTRPCPPSSRRNSTGTRQAAVTIPAATRNGAGCQRW